MKWVKIKSETILDFLDFHTSFLCALFVFCSCIGALLLKCDFVANIRTICVLLVCVSFQLSMVFSFDQLVSFLLFCF